MNLQECVDGFMIEVKKVFPDAEGYIVTEPPYYFNGEPIKYLVIKNSSYNEDFLEQVDHIIDNSEYGKMLEQELDICITTMFES